LSSDALRRLLQPGKGDLLQIVKGAAVPILQSLLRPLRLELARRAPGDALQKRPRQEDLVAGV